MQEANNRPANGEDKSESENKDTWNHLSQIILGI